MELCSLGEIRGGVQGLHWLTDCLAILVCRLVRGSLVLLGCEKVTLGISLECFVDDAASFDCWICVLGVF